MKIICTQENLKFGLAVAGRIISPSNSLPILSNILLKTENGQLTISSTNLEVAVTTHIRCKIEEEGGTTVFSKTITDLINNLPNENITLETNGGELDIKTEHYHTTIKTLPVEEFPLIPVLEAKETVNCNAQEFKKAVDQVMFAASTNHTQPELSGVYLSLDGDQLTVVATDRYRLAEKKIQLPKKSARPIQVIVPHKTIQELSRIIGSINEDVEIVFAETQVGFGIGQTQIISRLIDGQYPDYHHIIPDSFSVIATTEKQPLVNALRAGGIFSQANHSIKMEFGPDKQAMVVTAESQDLGKSVVELPSKVEGEQGEIILNHRYILDCLGNIDAEKILVKVTNDSAPTLIVPDGQKDYIYLVMPIKG